MLSDEPYNRIVFDKRRFASPVSFYDWTLIAYSYGKILLAPGERIGYLAISPKPGMREAFRSMLLPMQVTCGWMFPNNVLQYAIAELESLSIDVGHLQTKRDRMVSSLQRVGYEVQAPEGTFYLLPRSPLADDIVFTELLADHNVFVIPGRLVGAPGYFRICLTATMDMIERSLSGFEAALLKARAGRPEAKCR